MARPKASVSVCSVPILVKREQSCRAPLSRILATCLALVATSCWAASCTGQTPQHHPTGPFAFDTNSHVEYKPRLHLDVCIHNPDPKFYLRFAWFVPDWAGFAPPANGIEGRHFPTDPKAAPMVLNSCIEYGNAGALTTAESSARAPAA